MIRRSWPRWGTHDGTGRPHAAPRRPPRARQRLARARHGALHRHRAVARRRRAAHAHGARSRDVRSGAPDQRPGAGGGRRVRVRRAPHPEGDDRRGCLGGATRRHGRLHGAGRRARSRRGDLHTLRTSPPGPTARSRGGNGHLPAGGPARVRGGRGGRPRGAACARTRSPERGRHLHGPRHRSGALRPPAHGARGARRAARRSARGCGSGRGRPGHARAGAHPGGLAAPRRRSGRGNDPAGSPLR